VRRPRFFFVHGAFYNLFEASNEEGMSREVPRRAAGMKLNGKRQSSLSAKLDYIMNKFYFDVEFMPYAYR
jgi:hypothetical protein